MADEDSSGAPTSRDVARLAGVSRSAVSRAFTEGASLSTAKRERILEAAATLGYRPNVLARSLNKGRSRVVGVVFGQFQNPFFGEALDVFASELARHGLRMLFFAARTNATVDEQVAELLTHQVSAARDPERYLAGASRLLEACREAGVAAKVNVLLYAGETSDTIAETREWLDRHADTIAGVSVGPVIAYGPPRTADVLLRDWAEHGATPVDPGSAMATGITAMNLSREMDATAAEAISLDLSRRYMDADAYWALKSFSYYPREYLRTEFDRDVAGSDRASLPFATLHAESQLTVDEQSKVMFDDSSGSVAVQPQ